MSLSFSRYVRFIFHARPVLSLRVISLHRPSCRLVCVSFVSLAFPLHSPVFISVPFISLSVPLCFPVISSCFPVMSTSYFLPSFPCTSLHFPFAPQYCPQQITVCQRFRKEDVKQHQVFPDFWQKEAGKQRVGTPKTTFSGTSSNCRAVRGGPPKKNKEQNKPIQRGRFALYHRSGGIPQAWFCLNPCRVGRGCLQSSAFQVL